MQRIPLLTTAAAVGLVAAPALAGDDWLTFENETNTRLVAASQIGANDVEEKDMDWGDVDHDGDIDLVVVRKEPFTTSGGRRNVLFMNEGIADGQSIDGVLVDRTNQYITASDDGSQGFLDNTNDRDVILADVDLDGWLDVITSTAYGQSLPKTISHSRIYMNQGEVDGVWQGFLYEESRTPQMIEAPNTCGVAAGDITGDGYPDLYYVTYNSSILEDHLLVNQGNGFYTDETNRVNAGALESSFGTAAHIADMNNDGFDDIVKSENGPIKVIYNDGTGNFSQWETVTSNASYHVTIGDLNNDGLIDLIGSNDGQDQYGLNQGPGPDNMANFSQISFSYTGGGSDDGFAGEGVTVDLDNDGFDEVLISDVDVDIPGCGRRMHIFRNLANTPNVTMQEQMVAGKIANIPTSMLTGTHDIAVFDINGDGWQDLVIGRCSGTQIWINQPPLGLIFSYPGGLPTYTPPGETLAIDVAIEGFGGALVDGNAVRMLLSINDGDFTEIPMTAVSETTFRAVVPATECADRLAYYFAADMTAGGTITDPPAAPASSYELVSALGTLLALRDEIEEDVSGWTIENDPSLSAGGWEAVEPEGTLFNGELAAPPADATAGDGVKAFVTQNGPPGGQPGDADIDGGPTRLTSPVIDLTGTDGLISFDRWFFSAGGDQHVPDFLTVEVSNDSGQTWTPIPALTTGGTDEQWETASFQVGEFVDPTDQVQVRFATDDEPNNSITEAGIDNFQVETLDCGGGTDCPADLNGDLVVDVTDLVEVITSWGACPGCPADINGDTVVDVTDLVELITSWGICL